MQAPRLDRLRGMLGLAMRAGKVVIGTEQVFSALSRGRLHLVLISEGASDASRKRIRVKCEFYKVLAIETELSCEELGRVLGKTYGPACVGISEEGLARTVSELAARS